VQTSWATLRGMHHRRRGGNKSDYVLCVRTFILRFGRSSSSSSFLSSPSAPSLLLLRHRGAAVKGNIFFAFWRAITNRSYFNLDKRSRRPLTDKLTDCHSLVS
jgi:hypothetical protein